MATVKCIITYPENLISGIGEFEINFKAATEEIEEEGKLKVISKNVNVDAMIHVVGILFGPRNAICEMDVFIEDIKINSSPVLSKFKKSGVQLFNWSAS